MAKLPASGLVSAATRLDQYLRSNALTLAGVMSLVPHWSHRIQGDLRVNNLTISDKRKLQDQFGPGFGEFSGDWIRGR
jgi:hypothetical protein